VTDFQTVAGVASFALNRSNPDTIYVSLGALYSAEPDSAIGLLKSSDGGMTWTSLSPVPNTLYARALAVSRMDKNVLLGGERRLVSLGRWGAFMGDDSSATCDQHSV
jgi:hypothetical protein